MAPGGSPRGVLSGKRIHPGTTQRHSQRLAKVRQSGTTAEVEVGKLLRECGLHLRRNVRDLPGRPDLASKKQKLAVFVHGCFWHGHAGCPRAAIPKANGWWWREKMRENRARDIRKSRELRELGYRVVTVWECELRKRSQLLRRLMIIADSTNWKET